ncbi:unnamed protein product, partial [Tetraodon nigroviridis]
EYVDIPTLHTPVIDTSETELSEEKTTECSYSQMDDDTFQASMTALHGSVCSADLDYLNSSTPKVPIGRTVPLVVKPAEKQEEK